MKGLPPGTYSAVLYGRLPGTDEILSTAPVSFTLSCEDNAVEPEPPVEEVVEPVEEEPEAADVVEPDDDAEAGGEATDGARDNGEGCCGGGSSRAALISLFGLAVFGKGRWYSTRRS